MIMMLRPIAESRAGARPPRSRSHPSAGDIKAWPVEGSTGQMDLVGRIADLCEFIPTNVIFFLPGKECY